MKVLRANLFWALFAGVGLGCQTLADSRLHPLADANPAMFEARAASPSAAEGAANAWVVSGLAEAPGKPVRARLVPRKGAWDFGGKLWLLLDVANRGESAVLLRGRIRSQGAAAWQFNAGAVEVAPGEVKTLPILVARTIADDDKARLVRSLGELKGYPGGHQGLEWRHVDASGISALELDFYAGGSPPVDFHLSGLRGAVGFRLPTDAELGGLHRPCTDRFGQNAAVGWPLKVVRAEQLPERLRQEDEWIAAQPPLGGRSRFGGCTREPKGQATGHFRTLKRDGRWWLADPDGHLFWSLGLTSVGHAQGGTRTPGLAAALEKTPPGEPVPADLPAVRGENWNPYLANLRRKHGADWADRNAGFAHRRLQAWGINTLGNWSSPEFCALRQTPYVVAVHYARPMFGGRESTWGKDLPDVFDPVFRARTFARMRQEAASATDPWCIGYFIDNELGFSTAATPGIRALEASPPSAGRETLVAGLQEKYASLDALNAAWASEFAAWTELRPVEGSKAAAYWSDLGTFGDRYLRTYYETCRDAVRAAAPGKLYLGSRINHVKNKAALSICAEYADVVSVNFYDYTPDALELPQGFDAPVIIGEFHFGTVAERGVWGGGLASGADIGHAADLFRAYVRAALRHPQIVGAHWFQFADQPLSGRFDGENHRIGFVDITDTPYPEMVRAARETADGMYRLRAGEGTRHK